MADSIFDDLYSLHDPLGNPPYRGSADARSEELVAFSRAERKESKAVRVKWFMGKSAPSDVIWTGNAHPIFVSPRVVEILTREEFTGWDTYKARVYAKDGKLAKGYCGLAIAGRCDTPDLSRSKVVMKRYPAKLSPVFRGTFFDPESWDGSDFFVERPDAKGHSTMCRYVTGRVMRALKRAKVRNLAYTRLSQEVRDVSNYTHGLAYRLPSDLDRRIANARRRKEVIEL